MSFLLDVVVSVSITGGVAVAALLLVGPVALFAWMVAVMAFVLILTFGADDV